MGKSRKKTKAKTQTFDPSFFESMVEHCAEGFVVYDRDLTIQVWNRGMVAMTGLLRDDCVGRPATDILRLLAVAGAEDLLSRPLAGESVPMQCVTFRLSDWPEARLFEANYHPVRDVSDDICGGMIVVRDVTERTGMEQAMLESERRHRLRFMHSPDAILIIDPNGRYIDANPAACALTGYTHEELVSMAVPMLSVPEERKAARKRFDELVATGESRRERVICRKDGSRVHVEGHAIDLGDGTIQTSVRDISIRKAAEEQLHQALQRLQFHIERMPMGYVVWTLDMFVSEWNPAAERMFGWSTTEAMGLSWRKLVPESNHNKVADVIDELQKGYVSSHSINENICKDGTVITCEWFNTSLVDKSGNVIGVASMVQDVTQRELAEAQIRHAQKMESLGVLTRGIAHDFGNLLTVILGNLKMLKSSTELSERANEHWTLIEQASRKASDLTSHLLAFARTGRHHPRPAQLSEIVCSALKLLRATIPANVDIVTHLDDDLPELLVDRSQIEQVILNLCLNAAQAMPKGGAVEITTCISNMTPEIIPKCAPLDSPRPGPRIAMIVRDTGHGMDESTMQRIFDPFFSTKMDGHGLGLAAVLGVLRQHQAHVLTESVPGKGTAFHIFLPLSRDAEAIIELDPLPDATSVSLEPTRRKGKARARAEAENRQRSNGNSTRGSKTTRKRRKSQSRHNSD